MLSKASPPFQRIQALELTSRLEEPRRIILELLAAAGMVTALRKYSGSVTGTSLTAVEVKSGAASLAQPGLAAFRSEYKRSRLLLVGGDGVALEEFLSKSVEQSYAKWAHKRRVGTDQGAFEVPDDFNDPLPPEVSDDFER